MVEVAGTIDPAKLVQEVEELGARLARVKQAVGRVIFGQESVIEQSLITLLSGGHVLLVGVPGLGKTKLVETLGVVMGLVETTGMAPLLANVLGWLVAFGVSFGGHYRLTFSGSGAALGPAARRFLLISFSGFLINQAAYALALRLSNQNYALLLAAVLVGVAVLTHVFSRWWAFAGQRTAAPKRPAAR